MTREGHLVRARPLPGRVLATGVLAVATAACAADPVYVKDGAALSGYDPVAYFTESRAVKGSPHFEHEWRGVRWRFESTAHRNAFAASPEKYAPQYGGYCAYAVSRNYTAPGDPEAWKIVDGRLYVNYDKSVRALWEKELPEVIQRGDSHWPAVLTAPAR
jgi:hypothetical protein